MEDRTQHEQQALDTERRELLQQLEEWLETPMVALGFVWLALLVAELLWGLTPLLEAAGTFVWVLFVLDFALRFSLAPIDSRSLVLNTQKVSSALPVRARPVLTALGVLVLLCAGAAAANMRDALSLVESLQARLEQCRDYQCQVTCFERKGERKEERSYQLFAKGEQLVRIKVLRGRGKGSEAVRDASGRIRGRKRGLLKSFPQTLRPQDSRVRSLRGTPFWEATGHHFLETLRSHLLQPGTGCELEADPEKPGILRLELTRPGAVEQRVWIDPRQQLVVRNEVYERGVLVQRFTIDRIQENVGLKDSFFSF